MAIWLDFNEKNELIEKNEKKKTVPLTGNCLVNRMQHVAYRLDYPYFRR